MADSKADDEEDDWGFGDFTFASPLPNQSQNNDDDWGDFVESSNQSSTTTIPNNQSNEVGSDGKTQWGKLKGALPLSLFGENEEDEEKEEESSAGVGKVLFFNDKRCGDLGNGTNINSGLGINDIIANLYSQNTQNKVDDNGVVLKVDGSKLDVNLTNLDPGASQETMNENGLFLNSVSKNGPDFNFGGLHFEFDGSKMTSNGTVSNGADLDMSDSIMNLGGLNRISASSNDREVKIQRENLNPNVQSSNFGGWDLNFSGLDSNVEAAVDDEFDGDDDGWEFKDAYSESKVEKGNDKGNIGLEFPVFNFQSEAMIGKEMQNVSQGQIDLFAIMSNGISDKSHETHTIFDLKPGASVENGLISDQHPQSVQKVVKNGLKSHPLAENAYSNEIFGEFNHFAMSNGFSSKFHDIDIRSDIKPAAEVQDVFGSDSYPQYAHTDMKDKLNSDLVAENADSDEAFGEFEDAALNFGPTQEENEINKENRQGPMPLSIFGIEEPETDASLDIQDGFMPKPAHSGNGHNQPPSLSINDILTNLYSQAESTPVNSGDIPIDNELGFSNVVQNSELFDGDQDFEDGSWEFKDAASQISVNEEASLSYAIDAGQSFSSETKMNTYLDFYCKLRDELQLVCRFHLGRLKKARDTIALSGDDSKVAALDEEIQDASTELFHESILYKEDDEEDHPLKEICLQKFLKVLHANKFQALDSEYELSRKLELAEKELKSAIELIKHATTMVKILTVSTEEQSSYISSWFKMFSVCTRELQHGSWILKQSLEKNVQGQILSGPQGKQFILALGEIYRVVLVLGASVKLYKPWILSCSADSTSVYALLEECHNLWSCSGLEEALQSIADLKSEYYGSVEGLLASIKNIPDVDVLKFNHLHGPQESVCVLSGLTQGLVPDMKMVIWDGEHYFLTLANLWANLISYDPPKLTPIKVG